MLYSFERLICYSCIEQEAGRGGGRRGSRASETTGRDGYVRLPLEELDDCIAFSWLEPRVKLHYQWRFLSQTRDSCSVVF